MPAISLYMFRDDDFRGNTMIAAIEHPSGLWAVHGRTDVGRRRSALVWEREDREVLFDLRAEANTPAVTSAIDDALGGSVDRRGEINAGWIPWRYVYYYNDVPGRYNDLDLLVRISFDFHIDLPTILWVDVDGTINFYVLFSADSDGRLRAFVDGWSYRFDGGWPLASIVRRRLSGAVADAVDNVQELLDTAIERFSRQRFDLVYLLPGNGARSGIDNTDVDTHVSLALLPRPQNEEPF